MNLLVVLGPLSAMPMGGGNPTITYRQDNMSIDAIGGGQFATVQATSGHRPGGNGSFKAGMDAAAKALGMTSDDMRTALQGGATLNSIAQSKGVSLDSLSSAITDALKQANPNLSADQASQITQRLINGPGPGSAPRGANGQFGGAQGLSGMQGLSGVQGLSGHHHGGHGGMKAGMDAAAKALGMSVDDMRTALQGGTTLNSIAQSKGVSLDSLSSAITDALKQANPNLSADQASQITQQIINGPGTGSAPPTWPLASSSDTSSASLYI